MPSITNVGGSLTSAVALTVLAWGVRVLRAAAQKQQSQAQLQRAASNQKLGRFYCALSPAALRMLVETEPVPHVLIDVRSDDIASHLPLPAELSKAIRLSELDLGPFLSGGDVPGLEHLTGAAPRSKDTLIVLVSDTEEHARSAASTASGQGYERVAVLQGGLTAFLRQAHYPVDVKYISRDALALLLSFIAAAGLNGSAGSSMDQHGHGVPRVLVVDVRRYDERALYGSIPGTVHIPVDELPSAFQMLAEEWQRIYGFAKPDPNDWIVMQGREQRRAHWAAQLARDAGYKCCLVYRGGACGWRLHAAVKPYRAYSPWQPPPEPEPFQLEALDAPAAAQELQHLGLPL